MNINSYKLNRVYRYNAEAKGTPVKDNKNAKKYRKQIQGKSKSKIDSEFWDYILFLINNASDFSISERNEIVQETADYYIQQTGYEIPSNMLLALADVILDDIFSNRNSHKSHTEEFPIHSFRQTATRSRKETPIDSEVLEFLSNMKKNPINKRKTQEKLDHI